MATRTILPDIKRLAEKHHQFFLGERLCECSSCARICSSIGTVYLSLQLTPRLCCPLFFLLRGTQRTLTVCPTAGAQALTMSPLHGIRATQGHHCTAECCSRSGEYILLKRAVSFFVVVATSYLLSDGVIVSSCLELPFADVLPILLL